MKKIMSLIDVFVWNSGLNISRSMQYRFNFFTGMIITLLFTLTGPLIQYLFFTQTKGFPGWSLQQIILFQGVLLTTIGLRNTLFGTAKTQFIGLIRRGEFDRFLLRPFPPMALLLASSFSLDGIGTLIVGVVLTIYSIVKLTLTITLWQLGLFILCILFGLLLSAALDILHCSIIILTVADGGVRGIMEAYLKFSEYPLEIYTKYLKIMFMSFLPIAIFVYFPAQILLNRIDIKVLLTFGSIVVFFILSSFFWKVVLKKYTSAGG
ncbi:ABC transporter permease [Oceanirhabdus seepicola]|uniref:ABC-2 family transporter protein n=1 Tax=Oceanirhabdus seepicola TaxID=2828781 RepID=A0A9J6NY06_9CLOT|nr:ABC-2 family transporter protein [Oceanirhabdus seepicola]MCM1988940.1 ABC-2 family transporter protein [Oceanirhabdus seepicola]